MAGPSMKPTPMAAPTVPIAFARFTGVLMSEAYAKAAEMLPAMKPASTREASSHHRLSANPSIAYETHAPARLDIRMGRRPKRSLSRPQNGAAMSWHSEYAPRIGVMSCAEAPNRSAM